MVAILVEIRDKFIARHGRSSQFADHHCASVVGDFCRLNRSRSTHKSECKERNGSIAGARDIEDLPCLGWDVMRRVVLLKKHHAMFTERDENIIRVPFL